MAQISANITMDVEYRRIYWKFAEQLVSLRKTATSGQFLSADDFTVDKVIKFAAETEPLVAAKLVCKYVVPSNLITPAKEKKKQVTPKFPVTSVTILESPSVSIDARPPVQEADVSVVEHMEIVSDRQAKAKKAPPKSTIASLTPVKLPIDVVNCGGFSAIFPNTKQFGVLEKQLHTPAECSICAEIGPRIGQRQVRKGEKMKPARVLQNHEKVFTIALHSILGKVKSVQEFDAASAKISQSTNELLRRFDPKKGDINIDGLRWWDTEGEDGGKGSYMDIVRALYRVEQ